MEIPWRKYEVILRKLKRNRVDLENMNFFVIDKFLEDLKEIWTIFGS